LTVNEANSILVLSGTGFSGKLSVYNMTSPSQRNIPNSTSITIAGMTYGALAFDRQNILYMAEYSTNKLYMMDVTGTTAPVYLTTLSSYTKDVMSLAFTLSGDLVFTCFNTGQVKVAMQSSNFQVFACS